MSDSLKKTALVALVISVSAAFPQTIDRYTFNRIFERVKSSVVTIEVKKTVIVANASRSLNLLGPTLVIDIAFFSLRPSFLRINHGFTIGLEDGNVNESAWLGHPLLC